MKSVIGTRDVSRPVSLAILAAPATRWALALLIALVLVLTGCSSGSSPTSAPESSPVSTPESSPGVSGPRASIGTPEGQNRCGHVPEGPATPRADAVRVDPDVADDISEKTETNPPGTVFWLSPGTHRLSSDEYGQVQPKTGNTYIGAPGAVLDGAGLNRYAFTGKAASVTLQNLTVRGFDAPVNEGVVNHDSGAGWVIENNTLVDNRGAAMMAGRGQVGARELPEGQRSVRTKRLLRRPHRSASAEQRDRWQQHR